MMPVMEVNSAWTGRRGVGLPFTDFCAPLVQSAAAFRELWARAVAHGRARRWKYLELRGGREFLPEAPASLTFYGHELDLRPGKDALFAGLDGSVRRAIRKAEASGVTVTEANSEAGLRAYYRLHCATRRKHGVPPQSWGFFFNIYRHLLSKGAALLLLAERAGRPIAGALFLRRGTRAIYKFGASEPSDLPSRANNLVMWTAIKFLAKSGVEHLHFGRTSLMNGGLRRFKLGWGAAERRLEYLKYDLREDRFVVDNDTAEGLHTWILSHLPVWALRAVGMALYRHTA